MGREIKRVPLDFDWPLEKTWTGFLMPEHLREKKCEACDGSGYSPEAQRLKDRWYGYVPFDPGETGSEPFTVTTPEVRGLAERNVASAPNFYGKGESAILKEARRLAELWNGSWSHHLAQEDVDVLIVEGRLRDFTHTWTRETGWRPKDPMPKVTAREVNVWSLAGFGHDSINAHVVIEAKCERDGVHHLCSECEGHGYRELWTGQRDEAEAWEKSEPPAGDGWQLWETVSEGSPITPVFPSAEALVDHLVTVGDEWGRKRDRQWERESAESFVNAGWAPSMILTGGKLHTPENMPGGSGE